MGKMRKRLTMAKYAKKYKALRDSVFKNKKNPLNEENHHIPRPDAELETNEVEEKEPLIEASTPTLNAFVEEVEEEVTPEPEPAVEVIEAKPKPRKRTTARKKTTARKRTTKKKIKETV